MHFVHETTPMAFVVCATSALAVANIFYAWRAYHHQIELRDKMTRERVTYMLWVMANGVPEH